MLLLIFGLVLGTSLFTLIANGEITILDKGIDFIDEDDIAIIFYITVKNICKDDLDLSVNMVQCCEIIHPDDIDCNSMIVIGGDMGILPSLYVKNLTLIYSNIYIFNRRGVCSIEVTYRNQLKKKGIRLDIHFDTIKSCPRNTHKDECETIDLDFKKNCNPVDCLIKYSGTTSYFNPECKSCQKVPICNLKTDGCFPDVAYSPYCNECIDLNIPISKKDLETTENRAPDINQTSMINAICHYGKVTDCGECLCNHGWTTNTNDEGMYEPGVAQHHLCNIQVGDWNCINKNRIRITAILIVIFAITVISKLIILMCVMTWCYKQLRKPEKVCTRKLDSDEQSLLLCDQLNSFDKCLCCELEEAATPKEREKRLHALHSQTVNISCYPSSPSVFSSIKTSTRSSKFSVTSECSTAHNTTSTSAAISFSDGESSDESKNINDILLCEDETNPNIVYGVYCSVDDTEEGEFEGEGTEEDGGEGSPNNSKSGEFNINE